MKNKVLNVVLISYVLFVLVFTVRNIGTQNFDIMNFIFIYILYSVIFFIPLFPMLMIVLSIVNKNKKWIIGIILIILEFITYFLVHFSEIRTPKNTIKENLHLNIYDSVTIKEISNKGFFGDGYNYIKIDCSSNSSKILEQIMNWKTLPLTENLNLIMYGGDNYHYNLSDEISLPKIEKGYYYFVNNHDKAISRFEDSDLFDLGSFNFTVAIYDCKTNVLYYYEYDT